MKREALVGICNRLGKAIEQSDENAVRVYSAAFLGGFLSDQEDFGEILESLSNMSGDDLFYMGMEVHVLAAKQLLLNCS